MRAARTLVCGALLGGSGLAHADSYYLESEPVATRDAAQEVAELAGSVGCPGTVQRRYVRGEGWQHLFRSQAVPEAGVVEGCLAAMALPDGVVLHVVARQGRRLRSTAPVASSVPAAAAPRVEDVLARMVRAHAGGGVDVAAAPTVLFRFLRRAGGRVVDHTYARRDGDLYLEVVVREGAGVSSRAGLVQGVPWLEGQEDVPLVDATRRHLARFAPEHVLAIPAQLGLGHLDALGLTDAVLSVDAAGGLVLTHEGDRDRPPVEARVDGRTWQLLEIARGAPGQQVRWRFEGWHRADAGLLLPRAVEVTRGDAPVDRVELEELDLAPSLPDAWFWPPGT